MLTKLNQYVEDSLVRKTKHPVDDLWVYNYTMKTTIDRKWDDITLKSRGLVLNDHGDILTYPFQKFFNHKEPGNREFQSNESVIAYDKLDGSLIILFWTGLYWEVCTRGSFSSDQAIKARDLLYNYDVKSLDKKYTYLFEIIYPANRIVVDYGNTSELIMLGVQDENFKTLDHVPYAKEFGSPFVVGETTTWGEILRKFEKENNQTDFFNEEGYVIRFLEDDFRTKLKYKAYFDLHKIVTNITRKSIWEVLKNNDGSIDVLYNLELPVSFMDEIQELATDIMNDFMSLHDMVMKFHNHVNEISFDTRKDLALYIQKNAPQKNIIGIIFSMIDGKDYEDKLWKLVL